MTSKRKIAFLCHPYHRGGVTRWMADAAIAFAQRGWQVTFITPEPSVRFFSAGGRETMIELLGKNHGAAVNIISKRAGREFELGTAAYREYIYGTMLAKLEPGTPLVLSDDLSVWKAAISMYKTYPIVGVLHADEEFYYRLAEQYYDKVAVMACVSGRVSRTACKRVPGMRPDIVYTIPCGIELPPVSPEYNGADKLRLVYVGRVSEFQKRVTDLLLISEQLQKKGVAFSLDIIGDGVDRVSLEHKVIDAGLEGIITFHGWQSQQVVSEKLSQSDILLLTSDFEGTPIAMMEALAAGCGIVGTRVSGIEDYGAHAEAASCYRLYEVGDIDAAVAGILSLVEVPRNERRSAAGKLAMSEFTMDICLDRYIAAIDKIVASDAPVPAVKMSLKDIAYSRIIAIARTVKLLASGSKAQ